METRDWIAVVYLGVGVFFCVATWIDNARTHYVHGHPPSGIAYGLTWPVWVPFMALMIFLDWRTGRAGRS